MNEKLAAVRAFITEEKHRRTLEIIALLVILALIAGICISINMRANIQREYTSVRNRAGASLYSNLNLMTQTFDMVNVPTADVQNAILPQMKQMFYAAVALNDLISDAYSSRYALLSESDVSSVESAFSAYDAAFASETSTDLAQSNMKACMDRIKELLNTRYSSGILRATR